MANPEILIASAPHADTFGYSMPPPGLLRLGGALLERGIQVELLDLAHELAAGRLTGGDSLAASCVERLLERRPKVLGLSVMGATLPIAIAIAEGVRPRAPGLKIVLGGPGTTGIDRALLERFECLDAVVRGEGEITLPELLAAFARGASGGELAGVTARGDNGSILRGPDRKPIDDLAQLPAYAYELLPPVQAYKAISGAGDGLVPIDSGRGCVYDCSFCTIGRFWGRRSRPLPAERLVDEVAAIAHMPGGRSAYLCHDLFGADRAHALEFARLKLERGVEVPFEIRARLDHLDDELLDRLAAAGCYRILFGIESADGRVRNQNGKRMDAEFPALERLRAVLGRGIVPILSLILGLPGEDDRALDRTLELALRASLLGGVHVSLHLVNPQPGCGLGESEGPSSRPVAGIPPDMALGAGESAAEQELIARHPDLFSTFSLLTGQPGGTERLRELHRISKQFGPLIERYPKSLALLLKRTGRSPLEFFRAQAADGRSFAAQVARSADPLLEAVFAWEQARLREASRAQAPRAPQAPLPNGELVQLPVDVARLQAALDRPLGEALPELAPEPSLLLVRGAVGGIQSLRISPSLAELFQSLDGRSLATLESEAPGIEQTLERLQHLDLVRLPAASALAPLAPTDQESSP